MSERRLWIALWTPTVTTLGAIAVALITAWSGCSDLRGEVRAQTRAVDKLTKRVDKIDERVSRTEIRSMRALEACREK